MAPGRLMSALAVHHRLHTRPVLGFDVFHHVDFGALSRLRVNRKDIHVLIDKDQAEAHSLFRDGRIGWL